MIAVDSLDKTIIQESLQSHKRKLDSLGVQAIHILGSVARKNANPKSDIDFLITFKSGMKNFDNYINLTFLLEVKVDLLTSDSISGSLKQSVEKESILIEV
ncbi:nucleotidyltransferase family protein [Leptospira interrogans]|uniref:nucleotidyltransferase family protein n=1 Tax=Leptospira interrogans TaxID=173 RepID=UPI0002BF2FDB|nr:nucleotidyltransferase domain-containing protein [Leptospira interrogans]EMO93677.1 nucleotidyltransferase domain protein [Leptospira interrogans str. UI 13372]